MNKSVNCADIVGGSDGNYCIDDSGAGTETDPHWTSNRTLYAKNTSFNTTQFTVNDNITIKESWLDTIYAKIINYFTKTDIQNYFNNGTNVNASSLSSNLSSYFTKTNVQAYLTNGTNVNASSLSSNLSSYFTKTNVQAYLTNGTNVNASSLSSNLSNYYLTSNPSGYITNTVNSSYALQTNLIAYNTNGTHINQTYADNKYSVFNSTCSTGQVQNGFNNTTHTFNCIVTPAGTETDPLWSGNYSNVALKNTVNNFTVNQTFNQNITVQQCIIFASGGKICTA
jgi:hypothetical protein